MILVGDDQNENYREDNLPQMALYLGDHVYPVDRHNEGNQGQRVLYRCNTELANTLLNGLVQRDFDVASSKSFPREELLAHAHAPILRRIIPEADISAVLLFVNAIHVPAVGPKTMLSARGGNQRSHRARASRYRARRDLRFRGPIAFHRRLSLASLPRYARLWLDLRGVRSQTC